MKAKDNFKKKVCILSFDWYLHSLERADFLLSKLPALSILRYHWLSLEISSFVLYYCDQYLCLFQWPRWTIKTTLPYRTAWTAISSRRPITRRSRCPPTWPWRTLMLPYSQRVAITVFDSNIKWNHLLSVKQPLLVHVFIIVGETWINFQRKGFLKMFVYFRSKGEEVCTTWPSC